MRRKWSVISQEQPFHFLSACLEHAKLQDKTIIHEHLESYRLQPKEQSTIREGEMFPAVLTAMLENHCIIPST